MHIKVPAYFLCDHAERDLPTPEVIRRVGTYCIIDGNDAAMAELLSDADYYSDGVDDCDHRLIQSAKATVRAIRAACDRPADR